MQKINFRNAVLRETNGFFRDFRNPYDLVIIKNKAVKLFESLEEDDKLGVLEQFFNKKPKKINFLKNMLTMRGGLVIIQHSRIPDCDVEIVKYGTNLHFGEPELISSEFNGMREINIEYRKEIQPDMIKKFSVTEAGDLVEYKEKINDENASN